MINFLKVEEPVLLSSIQEHNQMQINYGNNNNQNKNRFNIHHLEIKLIHKTFKIFHNTAGLLNK